MLKRFRRMCGARLLCAAGVLFSFSAALGQTSGQLDAKQTVSASNLAMTNIPSSFNGMNVNNFLGADRFYNAGITGQSASVATVEAGHVWGGAGNHETMTHMAAGDFVTGSGALGEFDRHNTWVGMLIGGRNGGAVPGDWQTGIAPGAQLRSGAMATQWNANVPPPQRYALGFGFDGTSFTTTYNAFFGSADVINSSWGFTDQNGSNVFTIAMDGFARQNPRTTFVVAAGNTGPEANTVNSPGSGYNAITVGALGGANGFDSIASFSSRGPQSYSDPVNGNINGVRAAVDIVAPGTSLTSAYYGGETGGNRPSLGGSPSGSAGGPNFYSHGIQGTSFASPIVAGGATLLASAARNMPALATNPDARDARVIKAVLLNSADKTTGWNNGQSNIGGVVTTTQSLDWNLGAGRMNLDRAFDQYLSGTTDVAGMGGGIVDAIGWDFGAVGPGGQNDYVIAPLLEAGSTFTATLAWFRDRAFNTTTLVVSDIAFRDLDLQIWDSTFTTLYAQSISNYNDVEHLSFVLPVTGQYGLRALYDQTLFGAAASEVYGLAWAGVAVIPEPGAALSILSLLAIVTMRRRRAA